MSHAPHPPATTDARTRPARAGLHRTRRLVAACAAAIAAATLGAAVTTPTAAATPISSTTAGTSTTASALGAVATVGTSLTTAPRRRAARAWFRRVNADSPVAHLRGTRDLVTGRVVGTATGSPGTTRMPSGATVPVFDGNRQYLTFPSRPAYSIATTQQLTVEYWMRPDNLQFRDEEGSGYVYVLGKGDPSRHEWYGRMYSKRNSEGRPNRISGYAFNPAGGLGAGSYFQDSVTAGQWIHVALVFDARPQSGNPMGTVRIYKNGVLRDTDGLDDYDITPRNAGAPFRIGTGYLGSFFEGAVGDVVFFDRALPGSTIGAHYRSMPR